MTNRIIIDTIDEGGFGGEANVLLQSRNLFPGIGGDLLTTQPAPVALRDEFLPGAGSAHRLFLIHLIVKKLDDYFCRTQKYLTPHIARPFGSISHIESKCEAYIYEWVFGEEGFLWESRSGSGQREIIQLEEWNSFVAAFAQAGISVNYDIVPTDVGSAITSKNIIHQRLKYKDGVYLNRFWTRIDFGPSPQSFPVNHGKLLGYLTAEADSLRRYLSEDRNESALRYKMLLLAHKYLTEGKLAEREMGRLEEMVLHARLSQLKQYKPRSVY